MKQSIGGTIANSFSALPFFDNPIIVIDSIFKYIDGMLSIQWLLNESILFMKN